jgi:hypothetical protein
MSLVDMFGHAPNAISTQQWQEITTTLIWLWSFVVSMIFFAFSVLLSIGMIPSLVSTRDLSSRARVVRPFLYALAFLFLIAVIVCFSFFVMNVLVLLGIYPKAWI